LAANPNALNFSDVSSQSLGISEANYQGLFAIDASTCAGVAAAAPTSASGPTAFVSVTSQSSGSCQLTVSDDHSGTVAVTVTVALATPSPAPSPTPAGAIASPSRNDALAIATSSAATAIRNAGVGVAYYAIDLFEFTRWFTVLGA